MIQFFANGIPKGQPRPRAFARKLGEKFVARMYDAGTAEAWKSQVAAVALSHRPRSPVEGPVILRLEFRFPRPKSLCRRKDPDGEMPHIAKPDVDNAAKCVMDVLTQLGGFWRDDAQVATLIVSKVYCAKDSSAAGVHVEIIAAELEARRAS